jgi:hypothetical protein
MVRTISDDERRARLAHRHRLTPQGRTDDVAAIADSVVALHSSDPVSVYLSAMARMSAPSVDAVEKALYVDRSVVRHHAMRRTLWVATPEVARLMHAAATRKLVGPEHRRTAKLLAENGVEDPERWLADARARTIEALEVHGPMTARALGQKVPALRQGIVMAPGKKYSATISAHTRVLLLLGFEGHVVRTRPTGTWVNGAYTYAPADDWVEGGLDGHAERGAARELALRWLQRFGPGTAADLQWWAGWTVATTRTALVDCGAVEVRLAGAVEVGYVAPGDEEPVSAVEPWVALLPGLDPTTMGWKQRSWYLPEACLDTFDRMGNAGPTIWVDGCVVGGWVQAPDGRIRTGLCVDVPAGRRAEVSRRAAELAETIGETRFTVRFPSTLSAKLLKDPDPTV